MLTRQSSGGYGSKVNDLKGVYGALFAAELDVGGFTHWGWVDTDCMLGDLRPALRQYLPDYDVVTFPDGGLAGLYASGQLTVFRHIPFFSSPNKAKGYFRTFHAELICEPGNRLWDEKFVLPHAAR